MGLILSAAKPAALCVQQDTSAHRQFLISKLHVQLAHILPLEPLSVRHALKVNIAPRAQVRVPYAPMDNIQSKEPLYVKLVQVDDYCLLEWKGDYLH